MTRIDWTPAERAAIEQRIRERREWSDRLERLDEPLTPGEWGRLRLELRQECANHEKDVPLYRFATSCPHDVPLDDPDFTDELHLPDEDGELLCLAEVVGHACICQDGYCSQEGAAIEARNDLWYAASAERRRAARAAHIDGRVVADAWLSTALTFEQAQDLAAECRDEGEFRARVALMTDPADRSEK